jgi:hypothetical protein
VIQEGASDGVDLGGRKVLWLIGLPKDFASGNGTGRIYIDEGADARQRQELEAIFTGKKGGPVIVTPDTVLRWHRRRFREHWAKLSGRPSLGRLPVNAEIIALVRKMAAANPLWGAPRIHGELLKLGIEVAERTVSRLIPKRPTPP